MSNIQRGEDGSPLPDHAWVIRIARMSKNGRIDPESFVLTETDRNATVSRLSVYSEALTSDLEAWTLLGSQPKHEAVLRLLVSDVHGLIPDPSSPPAPHLSVEWEWKFALDLGGSVKLDEQGNPVPDERPGANGHAGIRNLREGTTAQRKSLRSKLTDLANANGLRWLPHVRPSEQDAPRRTNA